MTETNKALFRRWFREVWNEGREATIDELFAESGVAYGLGDTEAEVRGPAQLKPFVRNLRSSFPDLQISIHDIMAEEDKVMVRILVEGTHSGSGLGVPPSGRRIRVAGIVVTRLCNSQRPDITSITVLRATINATGLAKAVAKGSTTIKAKLGGVTSSTTLTVTP